MCREEFDEEFSLMKIKTTVRSQGNIGGYSLYL